MTIGDVSNLVTFYTGASSSQFSNADRAILFNKWGQQILNEILRTQDEWDFDDTAITSTHPSAKRDFVANRQDYAFSTAQWSLIGKEGGSDGSSTAIRPLKIKRVEFSYDGSNFYRATPLDKNERSLASTSSIINSEFQIIDPFYDLEGNALWAYPIPTSNVTGGIRITFTRQLTQYTSSDIATGTAVFGFDDSYHHIVAIGTSYDWAVRTGKNNVQLLKNELETELQKLRNSTGQRQNDRIGRVGANYVSYK